MNDTHIRELDLNLLTVFDAVLREGGVTKAAKALGTTQSALSHALNRLREYFHDPLFVKGAQGMAPTPRAESLREPVTQVMAVLRRKILPEARFNPITSRRVFTLCMTDMGELVFLPPLLRLFMKHAPECRIRTLQVPIEQIELLLASGDADLALGSIRSAPEGLYRQRLFMHPFVTIASIRNSSFGQRLTTKQFEQTPQVAVSLTGKPGGTYDSIFEEQGIKRNVFLTTPHFLAVPLLLDQHPELIATVPAHLAEVFERYGTVRRLQPPVPLPSFDLSQHWHSRFHHDPAIVWLRELIKSTFENYPQIPVTS